MSLTPEELRANYRRLTPEQLQRIAMDEAAGLSPEGLQALRDELAARGLPEAVHRAVEAQATSMDAAVLERYCAVVRALPCLECAAEGVPLNGTALSTTVSALVVTIRHERPLIACPACLDKESHRAQVTTAVGGWWGFPWGPIRTIGSLRTNRRLRKEHHLSGPNKMLRALVLRWIGHIEVLQDKPMQLRAFLIDALAKRD